MAREYTTKIQEMAEEGVISWETIAKEALCRMSEDEVEDMCVECDWITPEDFDDEDDWGEDGEDDEEIPDDEAAAYAATAATAAPAEIGW